MTSERSSDSVERMIVLGRVTTVAIPTVGLGLASCASQSRRLDTAFGSRRQQARA
jgi:hypothetical protein